MLTIIIYSCTNTSWARFLQRGNAFVERLRQIKEKNYLASRHTSSSLDVPGNLLVFPSYLS